MNRQHVNRTQSAVLPLRQLLFLGMALLLTLAAGLFYYSWQTARLAEQVAAQTALLSQMRTAHANTLVKAAEPLPSAETAPAVLERAVPQERWVF
ncbi:MULTISPECIES: hypothetical protein [unclassified Pseudomonas]|uniref:hypothetical protein n=1 Tax=unclassified Pseudomonas TaxID=196821 RepID=UPI002446FDA9|nr:MULTISPECIES: hypothetical protein [unclassified Pseudomonas]MDH0304550.1 hypothetical protein [Pseudomonas sp. GD04091]MDH1986537.1 hypothetical protein [Pseudomonas sp. GD03689]